MTAQRQKGNVAPPSKVLEKVIQARALGLESLSCIIPKTSNPNFDDVATETNATVFPLKESYRKNFQQPHSKTYWNNSAKDYRHELLNEIADEEEKHKRDGVQARPKIRRIPVMPSRSRLHHDLQMEDKESSHHDVHYNAILNVQEDEGPMGNSKKNHLDAFGIESQLRTDNLFQEYLRLMAICEKHEEKENAFRKARINLDIDESETKNDALRQIVSFDRPQEPVEKNESMNKDTVSHSRQSYDQLSISNLSSPTVIDGTARVLLVSSTRSPKGGLDLSETIPNYTQESLRRSVSFDRRWESFGENRIENRDAGQDTQDPFKPTFLAESSLPLWQRNIDLEAPTTSKRLAGLTMQSQLRRGKSFDIRQNQVLGNKTGTSSPCPGKEKSCDNDPNAISTVGASISTNEPFQKAPSIECTPKPIKKNEFISKITVTDYQHSLDPIFVSSLPSHPMPKNREKKTSYASSNSSKGILTKVQITQEDEMQSSLFDTRQAQQKSTFMTNATISDSNNSSDPTYLSNSSLSTSIYQRGCATTSSASVISSRDRADLSTPNEPFRRPAGSFQTRQNTILRNVSGSKERGFSDTKKDIDPKLSTMSQHRKREFVGAPSVSLKDSICTEERSGNHQSNAYGSKLIDPALTSSELSYTSRGSVRPITPSPTASDDWKQQFGISPERDVQCDKGKKHQFYEANPYIPAYSDSVIIGRPISPENSNQYSNREYGSIAGLSPVTCSGSQFRNSIFPDTNIHGKDEWRDESVDREPIEGSNATIKVQHLSPNREVNPPRPHPTPSSQTCMPLINRKIRSVVDRYNMLKELSRQLHNQQNQETFDNLETARFQK